MEFTGVVRDTPPKTNGWNLKIIPWKRRNIYKPPIFWGSMFRDKLYRGSMFRFFLGSMFLGFNECHLKRDQFKRKGSFSNQHFSGDVLVFGGVAVYVPPIFVL